MDYIPLISGLPLFEGLTPPQYAALAEIAQVKPFSKGQAIFSEGGEATGFYIVLSGRVKVYKLSFDGKEQILHLFGAGEPFGEAAVFEGRHFPAHAEALETSETLFIPRRAFIERIQEDPSLALNMLAVLSRRLRKFTMLVEDLSLKEVPGRLAAYLLYLSQQQDASDDLALDVPKTQLASLLGTIPETLSRILARMGREGLIESFENRQIRILDRQSLEELASGEQRLA